MSKALELAKFGRETPPTGVVVGDSDAQTLSSKTFSDGPVFSGLNANGVPYLNASKVFTTAATFVFDGSNLGIGTATPGSKLHVSTNNEQAAIFENNAGQPALIRIKDTSSTNSPYIASYGNALAFGKYGGAETMRIDASGNVGIGVTPSAWSGVGSVIQVGASAAIMGNVTGSASILMNAYYNGSAYTYINTAAASRLAMTGGAFSFLQAASGTANTPITFSTSMTLDVSGQLGIGTSSPSRKLTIEGSGGAFATVSNPAIRLNETSSGRFALIDLDSSQNLNLWNGQTNGTGAYRFYTGSGTGTLQATLDASANFGLNVTPSAWGTFKALQINGAGSIHSSANGNMRMGSNFYYNGTNYIRTSADYAAMYSQNDSAGTHTWYTAGTSTAGSTFSWTQAMQLDASGNLDVGVGRIRAGGGSDQGTQLNLWTTGGGDANIAAYQIIFNTGSNSARTPRVRIDPNGNVGIGTTSPAYNLVVSAAGASGMEFGPAYSSTRNLFQNYSRSGATYVGLDTIASDHRWFIGSNAKMYLDTNGYLGIGIANPATAFHVYASDASLNRTSTLNSVTITADSAQNPYTGFGPSIVFAARAYTAGIVNSTRITSEINNDSVVNYGGSLGFDVTPTAGGSLSRAMTIKYNGYVGIGTTNPAYKLHVTGTIGVNSGYTSGNFGLFVQGIGAGVADARAAHFRGFGGQTTIGGTGPTIVLQNADGTTNNITKLSFETASNGEAVSINCINTDHGNFYGDLAFNTRGAASGYSEKLRIMANGNVGIGTTAPNGKLEVAAGADNQHIRIGDYNHDASSSTFRYPALSYYARRDNNRYNGQPLVDYGSTASIVFTDRPGTAGYPTNCRTSDIEFWTATNNGGTGLDTRPNKRVAITAEGNVGIGTGTASPAHKLSVEGGTTGNTTFLHTLIGTTHLAGTAIGIGFKPEAGSNTRVKAALVYEGNGEGYDFGDFHFLQRRTTDQAPADLTNKVMTIKSNGTVLVGTTSTSGSVSNYANILAGVFKSFNGTTASTNSGTYVTLFTAPAGFSSYIVTVWINADDCVNYQANIAVNTQPNGSVKLHVLVPGNLLNFQMSGYNVQVQQNSGGAATINYQALRIGG